MTMTSEGNKTTWLAVIWTTAISMFLASLVGYSTDHTLIAGLRAVFSAGILAILEVSLSIDNVVVNAQVLERMDAVWRRRFILYGMPLAVFGMRMTVPVLILSAVSHQSPVKAFHMALTDPVDYARIMTQTKPEIMSFGAAFLMMISLRFLFDKEKTFHWVTPVEKHLIHLGKLKFVDAAITLFAIGVAAWSAPEAFSSHAILYSGLAGLVAFFIVSYIGDKAEETQETVGTKRVSGAGLFWYLEIMDASFSFDGVIGAFAISTNMLIISLGLGVGAMAVRTMTLRFVENGTLNQYKFLPHGAFWAIWFLSVMMFLGIRHDIPEVITGGLGAGLIGLAMRSSVRLNRSTSAA